MFIESFKLKKDGWHMKLMNAIWGVNPRDFSHICPYWWATIGTLLFIIPLGAWTLLKLGLRKLDRKLSSFFWKLKQTKEVQQEKRDKEKAKDLYAKLQDESFWNKLINSCDKKFQHFRFNEFDKIYGNDVISWRTYNDLQDKLLLERSEIKRKRNQIEFERKQKEQEAQIKRKQRITQATKIIKPVIKSILYIATIFAALVAGYFLIQAVIWLTTVDYSFLEFWNWKVKWIVLLQTAFWLVSIIGGFLLLLYLLKKLGKEIDKMCTPKWLKVINKGLIWLFTGIGTIFSIMGQMIKDNCPSIDWED